MTHFAQLSGTTIPAAIIRSEKALKELDFSAKNGALGQADLSDPVLFEQFVFSRLLENNQYIGIGGYNEDRVIYSLREHFRGSQSDSRSIHLGVVIWTDAGTDLFAPVDGMIHSYADNDRYGDYGPTLILEHRINNCRFYTLYGHLGKESLENIFVGQPIARGQRIGSIGHASENGNWPPHLHFQVITEIGLYKGDFPGVCAKKDRDYFLQLCPDPNCLIRVGNHP